MYSMLISSLLTELMESGYGVNIYGINVTSPGYADDLAIIALNHFKMNALLDIAYRYSLKWLNMYIWPLIILKYLVDRQPIFK